MYAEYIGLKSIVSVGFAHEPGVLLTVDPPSGLPPDVPVEEFEHAANEAPAANKPPLRPTARALRIVTTFILHHPLTTKRNSPHQEILAETTSQGRRIKRG
jgi:hypothetical protein